MKRYLWVWSLVLLFLVGCQGEYEEKEREIGYKGLAKINRFLAAERFANEMGLKASSYAGAPTLPPPPGATVILPAEALQSVGQLEEITDWMLEGGNLVTYLTTAEKRPFGFDEDQRDEVTEEGFLPFLEYYGLELDYRSRGDQEKETLWGQRVSSVNLGGETYLTNFRSPYYIKDLDEYGKKRAGRASVRLWGGLSHCFWLCRTVHKPFHRDGGAREPILVRPRRGRERYRLDDSFHPALFLQIALAKRAPSGGDAFGGSVLFSVVGLARIWPKICERHQPFREAR